MRYSQPQNGPILAERGGSGKRLILATLPGVELSNAVSGKRPSIPGTAPSATFIDADRYGKDRMFHPFPGANGYGGAQFGTETIGQGDDFTFIWVGRPLNPSDTFGKLMIRGQDGAGNGWSLMLAVGGGNADGSTAGNYVRASYVDTSPAQFDATVSGITIPVGGHQRLALVKRGGNIKVFHWATKQMVSTTSGNGFLRSSTVGISIALSTTGSPSGHNKTNTGLAWDSALSDAEVWSHLDNPWQAVRAPSRRAWVSVAATGSDATTSPSGVLAASAVGTPVARAGSAAQFTSQSAFAAVGTPTASGASAASSAGVMATASTGMPSASGSSRAAPAGVQATAAVGQPAASGAGAGTAMPAGVTAKSDVGFSTAAGYANVLAGGLAAFAQVGTALASGGAPGLAAPSGVQANSMIGIIFALGSATITVESISAAAYVGQVLPKANSFANPLGVRCSAIVGIAVASSEAQSYIDSSMISPENIVSFSGRSRVVTFVGRSRIVRF